MKNSLKIGSVAGIGIFLHWTFVLLLAGIFTFYLYQGDTLATALAGAGLILAVFACVVLHELGHALTAARFDVPTRDITIYPIGGVARLQRIPEEPMKEFWIAIAGPAVNVAIAVVLSALLLGLGGGLAPEETLRNPGSNVLSTLVWLNVVLVGFNMLPAFPMDGGRVLRALLATRIEYGRATQIAANVGQGMAILFGLVGLVIFNPILIFIALFVYIGAQQEAQQAMLRTATQGISVREAMMTRFQTLAPDDTLGRAVDALLAGSEHDFPVVEDGTVRGILTRKQLMKALSEGGRETRVGDVANPDCLTVPSGAMLEEAFARMQENSCSTVPVVRGDQLVGLLTLENVGELMMVSSALRQREERSRTAAPRSTPEGTAPASKKSPLPPVREGRDVS